MEVAILPHDWFHIAKVEFFVLTSGMRKRRKQYMGALFALAFAWAVLIAPVLIGSLMNVIFPLAHTRVLLMVIFPGLMRSIMMFLWMMLFLFPLSRALQEIRIGQWEIFMSNNVKTRDILIGTFVGKVPLYGLVVLMFAPILITPFVLAFEVSLVGQVLIYGSIVLMVLTTIWLSNFVTAVIQAKLGDSPRGNDLAKALSVALGLIVVLVMYGLIMYAPQISEIMGVNVFLMLPFTWSADMVSWAAITFNGIGLSASQIAVFEVVLQLDLLTSGVLVGVFGLATLVIALISADRVFSISAGARTESVTTVGSESFILRAVRRISPGPFGVLIAVSMKDFFRKAQNLSKIALGIIAAVIMPFMLRQIWPEGSSLFDILPMLGLMLGLIGVLPFAGTGFLESKDQLWMIQGVPSGARRFIGAKLASAFLIAIPLSAIPVFAIVFLFGMGLSDFLVFLAFAYSIIGGAAMVSIGITAQNPNYEDTKSSAHQVNLMSSIMVVLFSILGLYIVGTEVLIGFGMDVSSALNGTPLMGPVVLCVIGAMMVARGTRSLGRPEI